MMDSPVGFPTRLVIVKLKVACVPAALTRKVAEPTPSLTTPGKASKLAEYSVPGTLVGRGG